MSHWASSEIASNNAQLGGIEHIHGVVQSWNTVIAPGRHGARQRSLPALVPPGEHQPASVAKGLSPLLHVSGTPQRSCSLSCGLPLLIIVSYKGQGFDLWASLWSILGFRI